MRSVDTWKVLRALCKHRPYYNHSQGVGLFQTHRSHFWALWAPRMGRMQGPRWLVRHGERICLSCCWQAFGLLAAGTVTISAARNSLGAVPVHFCWGRRQDWKCGVPGCAYVQLNTDRPSSKVVIYTYWILSHETVFPIQRKWRCTTTNATKLPRHCLKLNVLVSNCCRNKSPQT